MSEIRQKEAQKIFQFLSRHIRFSNKKAIDIGCRSGENMLQMQLYTNKHVIGIDPDDSEFSIALENGINPLQLYKFTLQEFVNVYPEEKFDIVTVFLWNIPFVERKSFVDSLMKIINRDGILVVGFHDEPYVNIIPGLFYNKFRMVNNFIDVNKINKYIIIYQPLLQI